MAEDFDLFTDKQLVGQLAEGSVPAYRFIFEKYWDDLFLHAFRMLKDEQDAKDLVQELLLALWTKRKILSCDSLSAYLHAAVRNRVLNIIAANKTKEAMLQSLGRYIQTVSPGFDKQLEERQLLQQIDKASANLPSKMREVFELSRKEQLTHKEIAERLSISDKTVKKQVGNALKILKLRLPSASLLYFFSNFL